MKRLTFLLLLALCVLTATAQTTVTPPDGLETAPYGLKAQSFNYGTYTPVVLPLNVAVQGNDVYIQGLCEYLRDAWVKGTREGNKVTFPAGQYFGTTTGADYTEYPLYFGGCDASWATTEDDMNMIDVVMDIDAAGTMTTSTWILVNSAPSNVYPYVVLTSNTIVPIADKAATPATPSVASFLAYTAENEFAGVGLNIPVCDVDGNPIMASKLSYAIYTDIEKDIQPLVITANDETLADPNMTVIPFTYTDNYNIEYGGYAVYWWYSDTKSLNRIGVQSIYTGGGEERKSEISWYVIKPYADEAAVFDFNALDPATTPVSTSSSHAGDITTDLVLKDKNVTLTVSPSTGSNTANRFWKDYKLDVIQLRMYGGTMTFDVPEGCTIEKVYFNGEWNEYNEFSSGECDGNGVWSGSTQQLVVTFFSGGSTGNTKINSIYVVVKGTAGLETIRLQGDTLLRVFDLQGRELPRDAKGLVIQQLRSCDGRVYTRKVVR